MEGVDPGTTVGWLKAIDEDGLTHANHVFTILDATGDFSLHPEVNNELLIDFTPEWDVVPTYYVQVRADDYNPVDGSLVGSWTELLRIDIIDTNDHAPSICNSARRALKKISPQDP